MFGLVIWFVIGLSGTIFVSRGMAGAMGGDKDAAVKAGVIGYLKGFIGTILAFYAALVAILAVLAAIGKIGRIASK